MRGADGCTESIFTMSRLDDFVRANHPLQPIRLWLNDALTRMDSVFSRLHESDAKDGRPSIAPEKLIRALRLQVLYSISQRTHADGANLLQHAVSLVRRTGDGRCGFGPLHFQ